MDGGLDEPRASASEIRRPLDEGRVADILATTLPGGPQVGAGVLDAMRHARPTPADVGAPEFTGIRTTSTDSAGLAKGTTRVRRAAAVTLAHARRGALAEAISTAESALAASRGDSHNDPESLGYLLTAAAEAYATAGQPWSCVRNADLALSIAENDAQVYRATTLLAIGRALNGEYADAAAAVQTCRLLAENNSWGPSVADYPLLLGDVLVSSSRLDSARLHAIADVLLSTSPEDPVWRTTSSATRAMALFAEGDVGRAIPLLLTVMNGTDQPGALMMVRGFTVGNYADVLLARGEPRRALAALEGRESPEGHALCFDMQRAAAYLLLGEDRRALMTTDACTMLGSGHCLRTIPPVLLRRAVAHERLGDSRTADEEFEAAFHLLAESRSATPLLTLSRDELETLLARFEHHNPAAANDVQAFRAHLAKLPPVDVFRALLPRFTEREERLARLLRGDATLPELASVLHVSLNTLKSQSRSLYAKLGSTSRAETVSILEKAGFYD